MHPPPSEILKRCWRLPSGHRQSRAWRCIGKFHQKGERNEIRAESCLAGGKHTNFQKHRHAENNLVEEILVLTTACETTAQRDPANFDFPGKLNGARCILTHRRLAALPVP